MSEKLQGSLDYLKSKTEEVLNKPSESKVDSLYFESLKKGIQIIVFGVLYLIIAIAGNDIFDVSKFQGIIFIFGLLCLSSLIFIFWKKDRSRFIIFQTNHQKEMLALAQSSVHAVDLVTHDMRKEMEKMKFELIDNFHATIDAYQNQVNALIYEVLNEKKKIQQFYKVRGKKI